MPIERKLAAIMFTDIAGYTAEMTKDEAVAISLLKKKESILKPLIKKYNGTYVKSTGDGSLSYFSSAVDASICAKKLQESIYEYENLNIRVGVHLGDTIIEDGDIRGDGVNVAARLENMAITGSVFVSKEVHDQLLNQKGFDGISLGLQSLKGVGRLIEVFGLKGDKLSEPNPEDYKNTQITVHEEKDTPSVAIIPLKNKGAEEDIFYAYGISADLIKECSSSGKIRVESLDNIETIENYDKLSAQELASSLSVRYISTGSLWKKENIFQLSIELYDTKESKVVWSDRWQENWDNLASIKGNLSDGLLKVLDTKINTDYNIESSNPEAYKYYLKAKYVYEKRKNTNDIKIARDLLQKALALDLDMFPAKNLRGNTYLETGDYDKAMSIYKDNLEAAESQNNEAYIAISLTNIGTIYQFKGDYLESIYNYLRSYNIQSNLGDQLGMSNTLGNMGVIYRSRGEHDKALKQFSKCLEIQEQLDNKHSMAITLNNIANIHLVRAQYEEALNMYNQSLDISKEIGDKHIMSILQGNIAMIYKHLGEYNKSLENHLTALKLREALGDQRAISSTLNNLGMTHHYMGNYEKALDYYRKAKKLRIKIEDKRGLAHSLFLIGVIHENLNQLNKAKEFLEESLDIQKEIGIKKGNLILETRIYLQLIMKRSGIPLNKEIILKLLEETDSVDFVVNFRLYHLFEEKSYLESAYNGIKNITDKLSTPDEFLHLSLPKSIVNEWKRINPS